MKKLLRPLVVMTIVLTGIIGSAVAASAHPATMISNGAYCDESNGHVIGNVVIGSFEDKYQTIRINHNGYPLLSGTDDTWLAPGSYSLSSTYDLGLAPIKGATITVFLEYTDSYRKPWVNANETRTLTFDSDFDCAPPVIPTSTTSTTTTSSTSTTTSTTTSTVPASTTTAPVTTTTQPATTTSTSTTIATNIDVPATTIKITTTTPSPTTTIVRNTSQPSLAATGSSAVPYVIIAVTMLLSGLTFIYILRKRKTT